MRFYRYIIAITGHMSPDSVRLALAAGFDRYLVKPAPLESILETMRYLDGYRGTTMLVLHLPPAANEGPGPGSA
ncbi:hypothetical protein ACHAC9_22485 [Massilia sp. CMS3.1]|uniref:hypothetical protein n=1 Tax=Massilia sp. CMS3.1 TaxID=3373083 RepID=UPI003EE6F223